MTANDEAGQNKGKEEEEEEEREAKASMTGSAQRLSG